MTYMGKPKKEVQRRLDTLLGRDIDRSRRINLGV
jgi:hypothetical protein